MMIITLNQVADAIKRGLNVSVEISGLRYKLDATELVQDKEVTRKEFLRIYNEELNEFFKQTDDPKTSDNPTAHIYGYPITVHWNGIYCDCDDGATPYNYIIPAIEEVDEELD